MNKPTPLDCLLSLLQSRFTSTRAEVLGVLASLGDESLVSFLIQLLQNDRDFSIRGIAAFALGEIGGPKAIDALVLALQDEAVRYDAALALAELKDERSIQPLIDVLEVYGSGGFGYMAAAETLAYVGEPAFPSLIRALENPEAAKLAALTLYWMGDKRAIEPLMKLIKNHSLYEKKRVRAAETLSRFKNLQVAEFLKQVMNDQTESELMRSFVANVIGNM